LLQDDPVLEATWRRAELALARAESPAGSEDLAEPIEGLAYALLRQELAEEPLVLMEEALELRSGQGLDDPRKAWSQALYGAALLFAERRDEAADMLVEAVDQLAGADPRRMRAAQGWLERL